MATTTDPAQPELPSYLLASEKNTTTSPAREKQADTKISTIFDLMVEIGSEKKHTAPHHSCDATAFVCRKTGVHGILGAKMFSVAAPVCDLTTTSPHVSVVDLRSNPTRPPPHK
jgi:hypothetical protein